MKKLTTVIVFIIYSISNYGQETIEKESHGGEIISLNHFQIEMVKASYKCLFHPEIDGNKNSICSICESNLEREKKIKFYLLNKNFKELDISDIEGRVIIVFKDETQSSKKIRKGNGFIWVPFGNNAYGNFQQAILKIKVNNKKYKVTFGHPVIHKGHHH